MIDFSGAILNFSCTNNGEGLPTSRLSSMSTLTVRRYGVSEVRDCGSRCEGGVKGCHG
ncbi:hypothetical protein JOE52_005382 [Bradyrhizobium canariense]|nr:hypothetical protein [Bradyrhizobium canariense]